MISLTNILIPMRVKHNLTGTLTEKANKGRNFISLIGIISDHFIGISGDIGDMSLPLFAVNLSVPPLLTSENKISLQ